MSRHTDRAEKDAAAAILRLVVHSDVDAVARADADALLSVLGSMARKYGDREGWCTVRVLAKARRDAQARRGE